MGWIGTLVGLSAMILFFTFCVLIWMLEVEIETGGREESPLLVRGYMCSRGEACCLMHWVWRGAWLLVVFDLGALTNRLRRHTTPGHLEISFTDSE